MAGWRLQGDVVVFEDLRLRLHRLGLSHWDAAGVARSWDSVPLHREGDTLHAPCASGEALWLGAWLEDDRAEAGVELVHPASGRSARIVLPAAFQIAGLAGPDGLRHPLVQADDPLSMKLRWGAHRTALALRLHVPTDWSARSGRPAPVALTGPPPLPPRLG